MDDYTLRDVSTDESHSYKDPWVSFQSILRVSSDRTMVNSINRYQWSVTDRGWFKGSKVKGWSVT